MKKRNALFPSEREKECDHIGGFTYGGDMPCTGPKRCRMCGQYAYHIGEVGIYPAGTKNPYKAAQQGLSIQGDKRRAALQDLEAGKLSRSLVAWYQPAGGPAARITNPSHIDWRTLKY